MQAHFDMQQLHVHVLHYKEELKYIFNMVIK